MIVSVHIPKTAGSRFWASLSARYGSAAALYYGPDDPRTHPAARRAVSDFDAAMVHDLERAGITLLHGHFPARAFAEVIPDPSRYWIWLREPIERVVSHYHFVRKTNRAQHDLAQAIADRNLTLEAFARLPRIATMQTRHCAPFALADLGFVGVSELFAPLVATLGLRDPGGRGNANRTKPLVDRATRRELATVLADDLSLYSEAMELTMRRTSRGARAANSGWLASRLALVRARPLGERP